MIGSLALFRELPALGQQGRRSPAPLTPTTRILLSTMPERRTTDPTTNPTLTRLDPEPQTEQGKKAGLDLSLPQVLGGALAAMTAAALGSRFGVEGTIVGTALASVVAAVATAFYTASLRRTGESVRVVLDRRSREAAGLRSTAPRSGSTASVAVAPASPPSLGSADASARRSRLRALLVKSAVGALATFAIAAGALTLYEAFAGQALSGGSGTTFSQVQQGRGGDRPTDEQAPAPSESADPGSTAEPSVTPEAQSSPGAESSAQATEEPTAEPSAEPSAEPPVSSDGEPSATGEAPTEAPSQTGPPR